MEWKGMCLEVVYVRRMARQEVAYMRATSFSMIRSLPCLKKTVGQEYFSVFAWKYKKIQTGRRYVCAEEEKKRNKICEK